MERIHYGHTPAWLSLSNQTPTPMAQWDHAALVLHWFLTGLRKLTGIKASVRTSQSSGDSASASGDTERLATCCPKTGALETAARQVKYFKYTE